MTKNPYTAIDQGHSALITIDTQNDFTLDGAPAYIAGTREVIPNMVKLLKYYREHNLPIIHIVRLYMPDGSNVDACRRQAVEQGLHMVLPGSDGAELVSELKPDSSIRLDSKLLLANRPQHIGENEYIVYKSRWGAFYETCLQGLLTQLHCNTLVFCGCNYPNCPRASIYEASERDYRILVVNDAISGITDKDVRELENIGACILTTASLLSQQIENDKPI